MKEALLGIISQVSTNYTDCLPNSEYPYRPAVCLTNTEVCEVSKLMVAATEHGTATKNHKTVKLWLTVAFFFLSAQ